MTSSSSFKWLDFLEKEFDKSFVALDHSARSISDEYELDDFYETQRKLLSNLGHCFVQLVHKAQTIFQINAKSEAESLNVKADLTASQQQVIQLEQEKAYLLCLLQSCLLENSLLKSPELTSENPEKIGEKVQLKLANDLAHFQKQQSVESKVENEQKLHQSEAQNQKLRRQVAELESELVGARLDAKYLDKELAGRIQQIQILLAANTSQENKQSVWAQIEAEMHLQRSKTIANVCYSKQRLRDQQINATIETKEEKLQEKNNGHLPNSEAKETEGSGVKSRVKQVFDFCQKKIW